MSKSLPNPKTRIEHYLNKLAKGDTTTLPEPVTRVECYLDEIANSGGGGGGSDLPVVTSDDNGKVLKVINGAWDKGNESGGASVYLVTFTVEDETITANHNGSPVSIDDIVSAFNSGSIVIGKYADEDMGVTLVYSLDSATADDSALFSSTVNFEGDGCLIYQFIGITEDGTDTWSQATVPISSGGADDFLVEFTLTPGGDDDPTTVTTQTSVDAIIAAINAGKNVRCKATKRIDIYEGIYLQNVMLGSVCTHADMTTIDGRNLVLFDVYDFDSEHIKSWRTSAIAGLYVIEEGVQSEDMWMYVPWEKD